MYIVYHSDTVADVLLLEVPYSRFEAVLCLAGVVFRVHFNLSQLAKQSRNFCL